MIRGIKFKIPNKWGYVLKDILKDISLENYIVKINEDNEIWIENNKQLLEEKIIEGEKFSKLISKNLYYTIFANIHIYEKGSKISNIKTYEEFLKSDCKIIILIIDSVDVYIYVRNKEILNRIELNAKENKLKNIKYITDENDNIVMRG